MRCFCFMLMIVSVSLTSTLFAADDVLFQDNFDEGLSDKWQLVGLSKENHRIKDGALELRVHSKRYGGDTPMLKVILPFDSSDSVTASVEITPIDKFTEPEEMAGLFLVDESGREFRATKQLINGELLYSPPRAEFRGEPGNEDDFSLYAYTYRPTSEKAGPIRIIVDQHYAYFQVGPSKKGKYMNFFFSAIRRGSKERGFALSAAGAPSEGEHWVRFDNFRVKVNR